MLVRRKIKLVTDQEAPVHVSGHPSRDEMVDMYGEWLDAYPILSIEDGLGENDWEGWTALTKEAGHRVQIVGDDLFVTQS